MPSNRTSSRRCVCEWHAHFRWIVYSELLIELGCFTARDAMAHEQPIAEICLTTAGGTEGDISPAFPHGFVHDAR